MPTSWLTALLGKNIVGLKVSLNQTLCRETAVTVTTCTEMIIRIILAIYSSENSYGILI